ncbi:ComF family protein [Vibrio hippocampi]|nr:phosphoribosyltransferase family protein [Vibrio hippocampi]
MSLLHQAIPQSCNHLITVPMLWHKQLWRGFNLSETMAYQLQALEPSIAIHTKTFRKHRHTPAQKSLNRQARLLNVRNAFSLYQPPQVTEVAIIDDVVTTGATVRHLSELLLEVGVKKIDIYCLCRTPK